MYYIIYYLKCVGIWYLILLSNGELQRADIANKVADHEQDN